jgi:hypothetical protein
MTENGQPPSQDLDMHQFRYKRNIKYMKDWLIDIYSLFIK